MDKRTDKKSSKGGSQNILNSFFSVLHCHIVIAKSAEKCVFRRGITDLLIDRRTDVQTDENTLIYKDAFLI